MRRGIERIGILALALAATLAAGGCSSSVIARVEFFGSKATAQQRQVEYDFSALEARAAELDTQLGAPPLLHTVEKNNLDASTLLTAFGMDGATKGEKNKDDNSVRYTDGDRTLILYPSGTFNFFNTALYGQACTKSDAEYQALAGEVLSASGIQTQELTPGEMQEAGGYRLLSYQRTINGLPVVGNTGVEIYFAGDGIAMLYQMSSAYDGERKSEPIGVAAALQTLLTEASSQDFGRDQSQSGVLIRTVTVESVEMVYWDNTKTQERQTHIQPVYLFRGTATDEAGTQTTFRGYVRVVSDEITTSFERDEIEE